MTKRIPFTTESPGGFDCATALDLLRNGKAVCREAWRHAGPSMPLAIVLIQGRKISATFGTMAAHLGEGTEFVVRDHIDAIMEGTDKFLECEVGYTLSQADILADDWFLVS